jgi:protein-tyrosine phosphatase
MLESTKIRLLAFASWFRGGLGPRDVDSRRVYRLVFVCKGNICRSAYAHALACEKGLAAASCGVETTANLPADDIARRVAATRGVSLDDHRTSRWADLELTSNDLVLAMEPWHVGSLRERVADVGAQVGLLGLWAQPGRRTIVDPYGRPEADFRACFDLIDAAVNRLADTLTAARGSR